MMVSGVFKDSGHQLTPLTHSSFCSVDFCNYDMYIHMETNEKDTKYNNQTNNNTS